MAVAASRQFCARPFDIAYSSVTSMTRSTSSRSSGATEHTGDKSRAASPRVRYLCSTYTLDPSGRPEMNRVICLLLTRTRATDNEVRAFISQHIETGQIPEWPHSLEGNDVMITRNFAYVSAEFPNAALLDQLIDYCCGSEAIRFDDPLRDGNGASVGMLDLRKDQWQQTLDVSNALCDAMFADQSL